MKEGFWKKLSSLAIAAALVLSLVPVSARADDVMGQELIVVDGETTQFPVTGDLTDGKSYLIQLGADVSTQGSLAISANTSVTLDLSGYTLTMAQTEGFRDSIINNGTMVITDSKPNGTEGTLAVTTYACIWNCGTMYVNGGIIGKYAGGDTGVTDADMWPFYWGDGPSTFQINGGTFLCGFQQAEIGPRPTTTITDGEFRGAVYLFGTANISGGSFQKSVSADDAINISGGTFEDVVSTWNGENVTITGGKFKVLGQGILSGGVNQDVYNISLGADNYYHVEQKDAGTAAPTSPTFGVEFDAQGVATVTLTAEPNMQIYYSAVYPYTTVTDYQTPFSASEGWTVYAYAMNTAGVLSKFAAKTINSVSSPQATPAPGHYTDSVQVTLSADEGAEIIYTTNGEYPSLTAANGTKQYTGAFTLTTSATVKAVAIKDDKYSELLAAAYTITSGGSTDGGSSSGGASNSNQNNSTTTNNPDGSKTTTVTDKTTGAVTATTTAKDGTVTKVEMKKDGSLTSVHITISTSAAQAEKTVYLPAAVPFAVRTSEAVPVDITVPKNVEFAKVAIPVEKATPGTVAVIVGPDGKEKIVQTSLVTADGVMLTLDGSATVKIIDNSKTFADVPATFWATDAVAFATSRELFNGTGADTFAPNRTMTRQMLMTVLARLDGADTTTAPLAQGMAWAVEKGVSDGTNPTGSISREQLAVMLYRYAGSPSANGSLDVYTDAGAVGGYARTALEWAVGSGIISGRGDGTLAPHGEATRAQTATILQRYVSNLNG